MVAVGDPADEILNLANRDYYDMIVLGSQGRSLLRGLLLGTVHAKILHHARQPVLILRNFRPIQKILVAYRGSQCDQGALEFIAPLFAKKKPEITVLHVQETERGESEEFAEACLLTGDKTLRRYGYKPVKKMTKGDFVDEILKAVAIERYDLLMVISDSGCRLKSSAGGSPSGRRRHDRSFPALARFDIRPQNGYNSYDVDHRKCA
jgi:nucleotide-binding universal stress UspA family protein